MTRIVILSLLFGLTSPVQAHFYFIVPPTPDAPLRIVLNDTAVVDATVDVGPIAEMKLTTPSGQIVPLTTTDSTVADAVEASAESTLNLETPPTFSAVQFSLPTLIVRSARFQPRPGTDDELPGGLVLSARSAEGGVRFLATRDGKPVACRIRISLPDVKRPITVETDPTGLTPVFEQKGPFTAVASFTDPIDGEFKGHKYNQIKRYATLTVTVE